jgi:hypothetical protein
MKKKKGDNYFLDTEFFDPPIGFDSRSNEFSVNFISLGLVSGSSEREFYGVYNQVDDEKYKEQWIYDNVIRKLPPQNERISLAGICEGILSTFEPADTAHIWATCGAYDWFCLCRLFGGMLGFENALLEKHGINNVSYRDMQELTRRLSKDFIRRLPVQADETQHIAIYDARHERDVYKAASEYICRIMAKTWHPYNNLSRLRP